MGLLRTLAEAAAQGGPGIGSARRAATGSGFNVLQQLLRVAQKQGAEAAGIADCASAICHAPADGGGGQASGEEACKGLLAAARHLEALAVPGSDAAALQAVLQEALAAAKHLQQTPAAQPQQLQLGFGPPGLAPMAVGRKRPAPGV